MTSKATIYASLRALMGRDLSPREHAMIDSLYADSESTFLARLAAGSLCIDKPAPQELVCQQVQGRKHAGRELMNYMLAPGTTYDVWAHHISDTRH
jgi:hypothetical protein